MNHNLNLFTIFSRLAYNTLFIASSLTSFLFGNDYSNDKY